MSTFASLIRSEVLRLARKETRAAVSPLRKQITSLRRKVAAQRQQIADLTRTARQAARTPMAAGPAIAQSGAPGGKPRFSPRWMRKHRSRLGMSREAYAKLLGVSAQSVMGWESGRTRPRPETIVLWAGLRQMPVRDLKSGKVAPGKAKEAKPGRRRRVRPRAVTRVRARTRGAVRARVRVRAARRRTRSKKTGTRRRR